MTHDHRLDNVALLRRIWEPVARGESDDVGPFFDALADDVVFELPVGELRGKRAVVDYFAHAHEAIESRPFEQPLEYYGAGPRVVILGDETFTIRATGTTHRAAWAWVHDVHDGRITRIVAIQDLGAVTGAVRAAVAKAQPGTLAN
jgi:ketosteroid isomerase-like protein